MKRLTWTVTFSLSAVVTVALSQEGSRDTDLLFLMNGGYTHYTNFNTFEETLEKFKNAIPAEKILVLNAGGESEKTVVAMTKGGNIKRDSSDAPIIEPSKMKSPYLDASKITFEAKLLELKSESRKPKSVTAIFENHGSQTGLAGWGVQDITHKEFDEFNKTFPEETIVRSVHSYCHAAGAFTVPWGDQAKTSADFPKMMDEYFPKNRCTIALSQAADTYSSDADWDKILAKKPLSLKKIKDECMKQSYYSSLPDLSSDLLIKSVTESICDEDFGKIKPATECKSDCPPTPVTPVPQADLMTEIKNNIYKPYCEKIENPDLETLEWTINQLRSLLDELYIAGQDCQFNFIEKKIPNARNDYVEGMVKLDDLRRTWVSEKREANSKEKQFIDDLNQRIIHPVDRMMAQMEVSKDYDREFNRCVPKDYVNMLKSADPNSMPYSHILTWKKMQDYKTIDDLGDIQNWVYDYKADDNNKYEKETKDVLRRYNLSDIKKSSEKAIKSYFVQIRFLRQKQEDLTRSNFEKLLEIDPNLKSVKERYENLNACEKSRLK